MTFDLLVEPRQLAAVLDTPNLLVVDLSGADNYYASHIPGAVHVEPRRLVAGTPPAPGRLPGMKELERLLSDIGLTPDSHVIACDDEGGGWAARLLWTLECIGHHHYSMLDGGLPAWRADDCPLSGEPVTPAPSDYRIDFINPAAIVSAEDIMANLGATGFAVWDARSREEHLGLKSGSKHAGRIPGACNIDWLELMDHARERRLKPAGELAALLDARGLTPEQDIVAHCQSHHRSALAWFVAKWLGFPRIRGYDGSWAEWGNRDDTPIETG